MSRFLFAFVATLSLGSCTHFEVWEGMVSGECTDEADNDGDGLYDCDDADCANSPDCVEEEADVDCDVDADTDTDTTDDPPPPDISFELTPAEAEQGDVFIASLTMGGEDAPGYEAITEVTFYGDVDVLAADIRSYEVLVSVAVAEDGDGGVDLLVELEDGSAVWAEDILTIYPDGSGHEAGGTGEPDPCE